MSEEKAETSIELGEIGKYLEEKKIKAKALGNNASGTEMIELETTDWVQVCKELKRAKKMNFLNYMTALEVKAGYQVIVQLENLETMEYVVLKTTAPKSNPTIPSLTEVFPNANWFEREAYDMVGIDFEGHPNLTRILNPEEWEGYPLRKDYIGPVDELNRPLSFKQ